MENSDWGLGAADIMGFKGSEFRVQGSSGSKGSKGSKGVVRRIIIWKRRGVLNMVFTKDGNPVNLLNLQNPLNL